MYVRWRILCVDGYAEFWCAKEWKWAFDHCAAFRRMPERLKLSYW
jgi:hypothetical protein